MAKQYKGYKKLNEMIETLENQVIYVDRVTGELVTNKVATKRGIAQRFANIINTDTGRILSYREAKEKTEKTGQLLSYKEYIEQSHKLQDSPVGEQLTLKGEEKYQIERMRSVLDSNTNEETKISIDDLIDKFGYQKTRELIDTIGRQTNTLSTYANYQSDKFYDYVYEAYEMEIEELENNLQSIATETSFTEKHI